MFNRLTTLTPERRAASVGKSKSLRGAKRDAVRGTVSLEQQRGRSLFQNKLRPLSNPPVVSLRGPGARRVNRELTMSKLSLLASPTKVRLRTYANCCDMC